MLVKNVNSTFFFIKYKKKIFVNKNKTMKCTLKIN